MPEASKSTVLVALYSSASGSNLCPNMILHDMTFISLKQLEVKNISSSNARPLLGQHRLFYPTRKEQAKRKPDTLILDKVIATSLKDQEK